MLAALDADRSSLQPWLLRARGDHWIDGLGFVGTLAWSVLREEWDFGAKRAISGASRAQEGEQG
ncbi:MAG TPA: hypothetical protein VK459_07090 [Polyangiaceae bacterium]|nr:hypothetical protein [Polyangiaceae bacterium]